MAAVTTEILIVLALIAINGVLAMSELAIVSARKLRLQQRADTGNAGARAALALAAEPSRFLSTVQIGITLVGILNGAVGGATLARGLAEWLTRVPVLAPYSEALAIALVVLAITYLSLVLGELVPKRVALHHAERIAALVARPLGLLARLTGPAVGVLSVSTEAVLRLLGIRASTDPLVTEAEIQLIVEQGVAAGVIEASEEDIVKNLFRLSDQRVGELMTPRPRIVWLDLRAPPDEYYRTIAASHYSRFPVCEGELDQVRGVVQVKDVLARLTAGDPAALATVLQEPLFVPESMPGLKMLEAFKQSGTHIALVLDEYGGTQGLVTLHDVLEALVGDVPTAGERSEPPAVQRDDGSWLIDGMLSIAEFKQLFQLRALPDEDDYQTVGGFVMSQLGHIPTAGEHFEADPLYVEVVDMDGNRVDKVLVQDRGAGIKPPG